MAATAAAAGAARGAERARPLAPDHLAVYLSNSCNLGCGYCYVSVNQGPPVRLSADDVKRSIDFFLDEVDHPSKKITFLGGEPLLHWSVLTEAARHARRRGGPGLVLQTFTNGTLLSAEKLAVLDELDCHVTISLDGRKEVNDKRRVYFRPNGRSVFDDVMKRLEPLPKSRLGVSLVFTSETVEDLLRGVDFFYRMGFGRITFNPELYERWPDDRLEVLRAQLRGLARYYRLLLESGARPFEIPILHAVLDAAAKNSAGASWWHDCHNVVLGPDGHYYSCDKALTFPIGEAAEQRVGGLSPGLDWAGRKAQLTRAAEGIEKRGGGRDEVFCPMGVYFYAEQKGEDPRASLDNFEKVARVFGEGLVELADGVRAQPAFEELYVKARLV